LVGRTARSLATQRAGAVSNRREGSVNRHLCEAPGGPESRPHFHIHFSLPDSGERLTDAYNDRTGRRLKIVFAGPTFHAVSPDLPREQADMLKTGEVLDQYYLEVRCMLLDIAATLDRLDAAAQRDQSPIPREDRRLKEIYQSLELLADPGARPDRAERLLNLFSDLD
jgi:hypothetical protein